MAAFEQAQAGRPLSLATARRCRLLAAADDALDGVARDAIAAIEGRSPFEEARTRLVYGERLRRAGRRIDARRELERARELFAGLGAEAWAERARHELGASASRIRSPGPELDVLTAQELRVARAVAEGKSNRQVAGELFISPRTVEVHLSRVYRKLGITSRVQLARLGAVDPGALSIASHESVARRVRAAGPDPAHSARSNAYGAAVPPWIGPPSSPPKLWPPELPGSQPSLPLPRPASHFSFDGGSQPQ